MTEKTSAIRGVAVFCGSRMGHNLLYAEAAAEVGRLIARRGLRLVYGAGNIGLMGVAADAALEAGGEVVGVIPDALIERELAHQGLTELHVVRTMHARKQLMADRSDAFIALPGGYGTMDELFEILTWSQLGIHACPVGLLDTNGFYGPLLAWIDRAVEDGFLKGEYRDRLIVEREPAALLDRLLRTPVKAGEGVVTPGER